MTTSILNLEQELRDLQKQQEEVEFKIRDLDNKERSGFRRNRDPNSAPFVNKRLREGEFQRREFGNRKRAPENDNEEDENANKKSRLSSVITTNKRESSFSSRDKGRNQTDSNLRDREKYKERDSSSHGDRGRQRKDTEKDDIANKVKIGINMNF